ncbi:MAG: Branched-chain amino acid aminotransferase [Caldanaerobacter subterraneus]|jgi:branched-chain amino acid aminotransferase|uniref:Branched-chain-amino-acid aminotransferase n=2 Tax=Caldanaerobacter subterraneus TaxID=911092 RepID=Q8RB89_CALS4|nr:MULTISPECIES: branched-chain-amino-acid transaminase [Caldanaerobacter]AAM24189.1 Branched-chain amino acid aminotransferase/4-amino-4-deoxychorismate lyase [Caldanaerobacter subterraneus subsp. tengcongensis MB4]KUK09469.1 MAG: Branched-chain amino acid aminotransferase [Caldanaerobacter subterraneus]MBE3579796.1 branched-chain-amino-acid transaminase [Caldanaerobacter subterraneus]MCS3916284.1 branched-chain amino acid aminotransferase [Caldanaerobacter subterraneus subsp. tengcongensis MB
MGLVYVNGEFVDSEKACVSVFDHGYLYGDGIFEGIRVYDGVIFKLDEHLKRLYSMAKVLLLDIPLSMEEMKEKVVETVRINNLRDAYIRLVVSRGKGDLGLDPYKCPKPTVVIIADKIALYPESMYETGLKIITSSFRRNSIQSLDPQIKSLNYLNNILAKIEAVKAGYPEALILNQEGYVAECTGDNIFIISNGVLYSPPSAVGALGGITRATVIDIARELNIPFEEKYFSLFNVYTADECFLTGTAAEAIPVVEVDHRVIGDGKPGPITKKIIEEFRKLTKVLGTKVYE